MNLNPRLLRDRTGLNQTDFWSAVGVTQSGGSRYEDGRRLPKPVQQLLHLTYVLKVDLSRLRAGDVALLAYLKSERWPVYRKLRRESAAHFRRRA